MRKLYFLSLILFLGFAAKAQISEAEINEALRLVNVNKTAIGLSQEDLNNLRISNTYFNNTLGARLVYLQQTFKDIPVYNQIQVLAFKNDSLVSKTGKRIEDIEKLMNVKSGIPSVSAESAVLSALTDRKLVSNIKPVVISTKDNDRKIEFNDMGVSNENITAELIWSPDQTGKTIRLAWQVYIVPKLTSDYWLIRVDAVNRNILGMDNLTAYDRWDKGAYYLNPGKDENDFIYSGGRKKINDQKIKNSYPAIVNGATYRVVPFPVESPRHTGGTPPALVTDPWNAAPGNATSLKWHSDGPTNYVITRGNNVWAKEDRAGNNSNTGLPATSTTSPDPLTFNFIPDLTVPPTQLSPVPNQQFNITNLFYWINTFHDILYQYGFDEPAGNFQSNNQGRGGVGNDWVYGDAQDGSGSNNANFSTPPDGGNGRMQMFLWSAVPNLIVNSPANIAGPYAAVEGAFSTNNLLANVGPRTGQVVYYNDDAAGTTHFACNPPANSISGKIALIDRGFGGICTSPVNFTVKVKNAQDAGAIAVIMVNNVPGDPIIMGGTDNSIIIPAVMISQSDGAIIAAQLANNVNATMSAGVQIDGDVDNGVIVHEFGHGLSNRLTGGPANSSCLQNAEHGGEGWSDYYALMLTQDWAGSNLNTGFSSPRGLGTYAIGQGPNGSGIRSQKYCTDFTINNKVYASSIPAESHDRGEIWCAVLWDMTWNIIQQVGTITPSIYNASGTGGNIIALKLVTQGMALQPCSPGFIDARNAILQADDLLYAGIHKCAIWEAFRRRGMGFNALQGSSFSVTDQTPDFSPFVINITTHPQNATVCSGSNNTFSVTATGPNVVYQWQVSTDGGNNYSNISGATSASYTLTGITSGMNNNRYRCVVGGTCATSVNSNAAILTVISSPAITQQPSNATVCDQGSTSFSVTGSGGGLTYQWQLSTDGGTNYNNITNGGVYSGATSSTLTLTGVTVTMNNYRYKAVVSSSSCSSSTSSNSVILTVNSLTTIIAQPQNVNLCVGSNNTFNVTGTGTGITYQWQLSTDGGANYNNIPAATSTSYTVSGVTTGMNNYRYRCVITGACAPSATSNAAVLTVASPATIISQPINVTICESGNVSFAVAGSGATIYQWQVSTNNGGTFTNINGATTATLNLTSVTTVMNNNQYRCLLSNAVCTTPATSNAAALTVNARPTVSISASPFTSLLPGRSTTITATIIPSATGFNISWYRNGAVIPGVTGTTYTADITKLGDYRVDIVNPVTGCNNQSQILTIKDSASSKLFIFPSPNNGQFTVAYYNAGGANINRTITVYDAHGARVYNAKVTISGPYTLLNIDLRAAQGGVYLVVVGDSNGKKIAEGKVLVGN